MSAFRLELDEWFETASSTIARPKTSDFLNERFIIMAARHEEKYDMKKPVFN